MWHQGGLMPIARHCNIWDSKPSKNSVEKIRRCKEREIYYYYWKRFHFRRMHYKWSYKNNFAVRNKTVRAGSSKFFPVYTDLSKSNAKEYRFSILCCLSVLVPSTHSNYTRNTHKNGKLANTCRFGISRSNLCGVVLCRFRAMFFFSFPCVQRYIFVFLFAPVFTMLASVLKSPPFKCNQCMCMCMSSTVLLPWLLQIKFKNKPNKLATTILLEWIYSW